MDSELLCKKVRISDVKCFTFKMRVTFIDMSPQKKPRETLELSQSNDNDIAQTALEVSFLHVAIVVINECT